MDKLAGLPKKSFIAQKKSFPAVTPQKVQVKQQPVVNNGVTGQYGGENSVIASNSSIKDMRGSSAGSSDVKASKGLVNQQSDIAGLLTGPVTSSITANEADTARSIRG